MYSSCTVVVVRGRGGTVVVVVLTAVDVDWLKARNDCKRATLSVRHAYTKLVLVGFVASFRFCCRRRCFSANVHRFDVMAWRLAFRLATATQDNPEFRETSFLDFFILSRLLEIACDCVSGSTRC